MKTYHERTEEVLAKIETLKKKEKVRRRVRSGIAITLVVVLALVLFIPYGNQPPSVRKYMGSPYYALIKKINIAKYEKPKYDNLFSEIVGSAGSILENGVVSAPGAPMPDAPANGATGEGMPEENYQEVTDNQVQGVIEGDLIKRSDKYIYYLHRDFLKVYSIAGEDSTVVGTYPLLMNNSSYISNYTAQYRQMYLSEDCTTITLVLASYTGLTTGNKISGYYVHLVNLDVRDPSNISETNRICITGNHLSSRLVDGKLLVMTRYYIPKDADFSQPETFVPQIGEPENMKCIPADSVIAPDELSNTTYTVVTMLDQKTLEVSDTAAFLSYANEVYVTEDTIFATRNYRKTVKTATEHSITDMADIAAISYDAESLSILGNIEIEGHIKNQYSMDEHDGVLRVVTSTSRIGSYLLGISKDNVNLYCIDLANWSILATVEAFAPDGEEAESVRFDGDYAYVCTAEVITLTDPVYFFDLSDLSNITWKDTGTIEGYSSSLVNFGNGNLIGIGFGEKLNLKIEAYRETETGVESICAYERYASFGNDYKSYYIDRENQLIGLGVYGWWDDLTGSRYILLGFDGVAFHELANIPVSGREDEMRGVVIDGWLYVFSDGFNVVKIW